MKTAQLNADILGLKLWYEDGSVVRIPFHSLPEGWTGSPAFGLQVVAIYDRGGWAQWFAGHDYYAMTSAEIVETNIPSDIPQDSVVKQGSEMEKDAFLALYNSAMQSKF